MATRFFIDQDARLFVVGPRDSNSLPKISLKNRDNYSLELYFLRQTGIFGKPYSFENRSSATISIGIGQLSSSALASAVVTTNLPTVVSSTTSIITGGTATTSEIQRITFSPKAYGGVWNITMPEDSRTLASAVTTGVFITSTYHGFVVNQPVTFPSLSGASGVTANIQYYVYDIPAVDRFRIALSKSGTVMTAVTASSGTVSTPARTTELLAATADATDVKAALETLDTVGSGNIAVEGTTGDAFWISFRSSKGNANLPTLSVLASSLTPAYGKSGSINVSAAGLQTIIDASGTTDAVDLTLEVEINDTGSVIETYATKITVFEDLI